MKGFRELEEPPERMLLLLLLPPPVLLLLLPLLLLEADFGGCDCATKAGRSRMPCGLPKILGCELVVAAEGCL